MQDLDQWIIGKELTERKQRILFICKKNETYGFTSYTRRSSGLYNSTKFIVKGLRKRGIEASITEVIDNNCIDRAVTEFRPDIVIIEALWVVPEKFPELQKLHPKVKWFCHLHSDIPFLALEGIAMGWLKAYANAGVGLIANSAKSYDALRRLVKDDQIVFLPNVYIPRNADKHMLQYSEGTCIHVGCFGAVRPMKNQLVQAIAAIQFARESGRFLYFHINATRSETNGDPVLKNIRQLFESLSPCSAHLVEHPWYEPEDFLEVLRLIDVGLQVSMTETFNVVTADYVTVGVPVVASKEVTWVSRLCKSKDDSVSEIVKTMHRVWRSQLLTWWNKLLLWRNSIIAQRMWLEFVRSLA